MGRWDAEVADGGGSVRCWSAWATNTQQVPVPVLVNQLG